MGAPGRGCDRDDVAAPLARRPARPGLPGGRGPGPLSVRKPRPMALVKMETPTIRSLTRRVDVRRRWAPAGGDLRHHPAPATAFHCSLELACRTSYTGCPGARLQLGPERKGLVGQHRAPELPSRTREGPRPSSPGPTCRPVVIFSVLLGAQHAGAPKDGGHGGAAGQEAATRAHGRGAMVSSGLGVGGQSLT